MNKVFLVGRLVADPEVRVTQTGIKVANLRLAVDDGKSKEGVSISQYFNLSCWDKLADVVESYTKKGFRIAVSGKLNNRSWDKPDGSKGYATDIRVNELDILTSKAEADLMGNTAPGAPGSNNTSTSAQNQKQSTPKEDDQLPEIDVESLNVQMPF